VTALAIDHLGVFGLPRVPLSLTRVAGAALLVAGVVLMRR
jgi:transporter family-2 protein